MKYLLRIKSNQESLLFLMMKGQRSEEGAVSIYFINLLFILGLLMSFVAQTQLVTERNIQYRARAYLCFKTQVLQQKKHIKAMALLNYSILLANALKLAPPTKAAGEALYEASQIAQRISNKVFHVKKLKNSHCSTYSKVKLRSPYGNKLKRDALGLAITRKNEWKLKVPIHQVIGLGHLTAKFKVKSPLTKVPKISAKEFLIRKAVSLSRYFAFL